MDLIQRRRTMLTAQRVNTIGDVLATATLAENAQNLAIYIPDDAFSKYNFLLVSYYLAPTPNMDWIYFCFNSFGTNQPYGVAQTVETGGGFILLEEEGGWRIGSNEGRGPIVTPAQSGNYAGIHSYRGLSDGRFISAGSKLWLVGIK